MTARDVVYLMQGVTVHINGQRGTLRLIRYGIGGTAIGVYIRLDLAPVMLYATLGARLPGNHAEIEDSRTITRDEFDTLTGLAEVRLNMGWDNQLT